MSDNTDQDLGAAEGEVKAHSASLRKELSLWNLVFTQVLFLVGLNWLGSAAKVGSSHVMFWLPAVALFYIPSAVVVLHLNREMPLEGGLYQWAKLRFGDMVGFLVAWNLWAFAVLALAESGLLVTNNLSYALGASGAWVAHHKPAIMLMSALMTFGFVLVAHRGLRVGKWIQDAGGLTFVVLFGAMMVFAIPHWLRGAALQAPAAFAPPAPTLFNLNVLGKMAFGAFWGFEAVAIFAGECRGSDPERLIRRSVWIAAPLIGAIYILGTAAVVVFVKPADLDLIAPVTQVLSLGTRSTGGSLVVPFVVTLTLIMTIAKGTLFFNSASRLPMVAGWDHLLPLWFTRLHPIYRTPTGSVLFLGVVALAFAVVTNLDVGNQEALQLLVNTGAILYAITYLVMFAIPLVAPGEKPTWTVRIAAISGFLMTLLFVLLSVFPIIEVKNETLFTVKISSVVIAANLAGALLYWRAEMRRRSVLRSRQLAAGL